jgi:hypothetical protein
MEGDTQDEAFRRAREEATKLAMTVASAFNLIGLLACPRATARAPQDRWPGRDALVSEIDAYLTCVARVRDDPGGWNLKMLASEPHAQRLRELLSDWTPSPALPLEITHAARDCLAALDVPEPPEGWEAFEGFPDTASQEGRPDSPASQPPAAQSTHVAVDVYAAMKGRASTVGAPSDKPVSVNDESRGVTPPNVVAEIIHGSLRVHAWPTVPQAHAISALGVELGSPFQRRRGGPGGWWILDAPEVRFPGPSSAHGEDLLIPDLAGWRRERLPRLPTSTYLTLAPDWACEVLSPETEENAREVKMPLYAHEGVRWVWLLDPLARVLEIYKLAEGRRWGIPAVHRDTTQVHAAPFDAIELDLSALWVD